MNTSIHLPNYKYQKSVLILILSFLISNFTLAQEYIVSINPVKTARSEINSSAGNGQIIPPKKILQVSSSESILQDRPPQITLELGDIFPINVYSGPKLISLEIYDVLAPDAKLVASTKESDRTVNLQFATYRGRIDKDAWISLSFIKLGTMGWIRLNNRTFTIQPILTTPSRPNTQEHFIIEISNQNQGGNWCGVNTESLSPQIKELMSKLSSFTKRATYTPLTAKLAVETDYQTYVGFGNDVNLTTSWLLSIISAVSSIYEQEVNVKLEVVYSRVWTTADDPYPQPGSLLFSEFENYWTANMQSVERDVAVLIIKDANRLSGGMGSIDALTDKQRAYAISGEDILTVAHELGHVFGSPHTHNCSWPAGPGGTLAPIDKCATVEGNCNISEIVPQEGTIMSYCQTKTQTFGTLVSNLIRARAESNLGAGDLEVSAVTGKVTISGSGLANVNITSYRGDGTKGPSTTTAEDGSYSLNLFYDDYTISADKDGFLLKPIGVPATVFYVNVATSPVTGLNFDALVLNADQYEPDDNYNQAALIPVDGSIQQHTLNNFSDIDFIKLNAIAGKSYFIALKLDNLFGFPIFSILDTDGVTTLQIASGTPYMIWQAPQTGIYYLKIESDKCFYGVSVTLAPFLKTTEDITPLEYSDADWGDYDGDGDLDLLLAGIDSNGTFKTVLYRNDNRSLVQTDAGIDQSMIKNISNAIIKWVDIDNDGDLDAFIGCENFAYIYLNSGDNFTNVIKVDNNLNSLQSAVFGDYDNDGDLDILVQSSSDVINLGDFPLIHIYRNDHGVFLNINLGLRGVSFGKAIWGDYDGDGELDIIVIGASNVNQDGGGSSSDDNPFIKVYRNINGNFSEANIDILPVAGNPDLAFGDYDNDGNLDLGIAGMNSSKFVASIYRNDKGKYTDINAGLTGVDDADLKWGDYDNDGYLDLILTGEDKRYGAASPLTKLYINNGVKIEEASFNSFFPNIEFGTVTWADYDNDGDLDLLLVGQTYNWQDLANLFSNETETKNLPPSAPTGLSALVVGNTVTLSWVQSQDDKTPSKGLTYNLCIGTTPGGVDILSPMSNIESGNRKIVDFGNAGHLTQRILNNLQPKTYYWTVQAIDNSFAGGPFASIQSFEVSTSTSISKLFDSKKEIKVYPNPVSNILTIEYADNNKEIGFDILNSVGQIVLSGKLINKAIVQTSTFSPGIYLIKLNTGKTIEFNKIIKQ